MKLILSLAIAGTGLFPSAAASAPPLTKIERQLVQSCRVAVVTSSFKRYADEVPVVFSPAQGHPMVMLGSGQEVTCTFASENPPQLDMVHIGGCYECGVALAPDEIHRLNLLLRQYWSPTP